MSISKNEIKLIRSLQQKKFRMQEQLFVIEGKKAVEEALNFESRLVKVFTTDEDFSLKFRVPLIHARDMEQISSLMQPPGYLAVLKQEFAKLSEMNGKTFCIANAIADPGNLGTLIRTCEWFGLDALLLDDECVDVYNPKVVQATMGSVLRLPFASATANELIEYFRLKDIPLLAADLNGMPIQSFKAPAQWALVVGSESHGVSEQFVEASATRLTIPSMGSAESLNASIAGGIAIFQLKVNA
jgi:TrmH family RNA methyltransferase